MKLRSPAEYYLKYLTVHPDGYTFDQIKTVCEESGLDYFGEEYVNLVRDSCIPPKPFRPTDTLHTKSQRFLLEQKIRSLFIPDASMRTVWKLLESPRAREFVESMTLNHAPTWEIAKAISKFQRIPCTSEDIERYQHFFWNIELLDTTQMRMLLNYRVSVVGDSGEGASKEKRALHEAARKASYTDPRRLAADLPFSPLTALMTQMRMGSLPGKFEVAKAAEFLQVVSVLKAAEATMYGGPKDSVAALNFSIVAKNMTDVLESLIRPDEDLREQLHQIALRTETAPLPSIHQLSGGSHTVNVQPIKQDINEPPGAPETSVRSNHRREAAAGSADDVPTD